MKYLTSALCIGIAIAALSVGCGPSDEAGDSENLGTTEDELVSNLNGAVVGCSRAGQVLISSANGISQLVPLYSCGNFDPIYFDGCMAYRGYGINTAGYGLSCVQAGFCGYSIITRRLECPCPAGFSC